tara:strand:- start:79 stop:231 length:153 start_codon:yes stop_codon:yes gene_type:complete
MTQTTALGMLRIGNTGNEILQILDVIVADITKKISTIVQSILHQSVQHSK